MGKEKVMEAMFVKKTNQMEKAQFPNAPHSISMVSPLSIVSDVTRFRLKI